MRLKYPYFPIPFFRQIRSVLHQCRPLFVSQPSARTRQKG
ncbi:hypothetical protein THDSLph1_CDS0044 [Terrisporobacter phage TPDSL_ph1]